MMDQLIIGNKASYDDFEASVRERKIHMPEKKSIKDTVPFSNKTYDFSAINGEAYWNERSLEYVFEIWADSPEELETKKQRFFGWIMNVMEEDIHDPFIDGYHFVGTYDSSDPEDDEHIDKTTITVKFTAYPYMIANEKTELVFKTYKATPIIETIEVNSSHRIMPKITTGDQALLSVNGNQIMIQAGTFESESVYLMSGTNRIQIQNLNTDSSLTMEFWEEVL